jgi:tetratricopeptide (TPR) repeat protein
MRVARYFPFVAVAVFIYQVELPSANCAWDSAVTEDSDTQVAPQPRGRVVDDTDQQAGFYDSRPRTNSTTMPSADSNPLQHNGALFHGQPMHLPTGFFNRPKQTAQQQPQATRPNGPQSAANKPQFSRPQPNNSAQMRQRVVPAPNGQVYQQVPKPMPMQQGALQHRAVMAAPRTGASTSYQTSRNAANIPPQPTRVEPPMQVMELAARPIMPPRVTKENTSPVSPWNGATTQPAGTAPPASNAPPSAAVQRQPLAATPADRIVAQAHAFSNKAKTEQDYSQIIETCRRALASQPSPATSKYTSNLTAWAFNRRGQLKAEAGHDKDAILDFDDAIRADATCWRAVHNRGVLLAQAGQFEKAFDDFSRTIQVNPQFGKAYSNRAALFMVANNLNAASKDYNRAIELDPNLAVAHRGYGRVCQLMGHTEEAINHYDAAVQLAPSDAYAAACRADLLTDVGRYSDALSEYNRALQLDPKSTQANSGSAWLLATCPDSALRDPQLALERAQSAIELGGQKDAIGFDSLAAAQASAGDFAAAMQSIHKAIELAPADERDAYRERLATYQAAKPYRIAPVERVALQVSYETK